MAYKKTGNKRNKSRSLTPQEERKAAKARSDYNNNLLGERLLDLLCSQQEAYSDNDVKVGFDRNISLPLKYDKTNGEHYRPINIPHLILASQELNLKVNKWISRTSTQQLIKQNIENLPKDFDLIKTIKDLPQVNVYKTNKIIYRTDGEGKLDDKEELKRLNDLTDDEIKKEGYAIYYNTKVAGKVIPMEHLKGLIKQEVFDNDPDFNRPERELSDDLRNAYLRQKTNNMIKGAGLPVIERESDSAHYSPAKHHIVIPLPHQFYNEESRFTIVGHEICHSLAVRCRPKGKKEEDVFLPKGHKNFKKAYASEEVMAESGALILAATNEIPTISQHVGYIKPWYESAYGKDYTHMIPLFYNGVKRANIIQQETYEYELKQKLELEQKLPNSLEATDLRISGDTIYQTYRSVNEPDKSFIVEVDLKDLDKDTFINEKHLTDFAKNHRGSKSISEYSAALKSDLKEHTVLSFETNRVVLQAQEQERLKAKAEQKQDVSQEVEQKQTKRAKLSA
ncbi:hypothetical protein L0991_03615 [Vibrio chagasii]|uniref:zincin-like metallopeptidase domain-containing protein n=1 Tax=Vibrio chagasii TaxID=170679 RepID=UPI0035A66685